MEQEIMEAIAPPQKKCEIKNLLKQKHLDLIKVSPTHETIRGLILSWTGKMPPAECDSYEKIVEWLEWNVEARIAPAQAVPGVPVAVAGRRTRTTAFGIDIDFTEDESGRCRYTVTNYGSDVFEFTAEEVSEMVREAAADGDEFSDVLRRLKELVSDEVHERTNPSMEQGGDGYNYDDHESSNNDQSWDIADNSQLKTRLIEFIAQNHSDLMEQLGM